ncbi:hypothetical protein QEM13_002929 [Pseudomonas putida]|uniref:hypothetical protein n=1 Tax=Pseudomonas sp. p1(2021b) TaxID=2874628 RepID=UPI001CCA221B|nr:hypothetical protein [Pseudomonas sp. p1(2021b)]EKT4523652.1 hypothetical protein [Pseudomonas putida]UBM24802.1 hypothetical protein K8374_20980 [Pseudomonas sp. p1(2021b)]
MSEKIENQRVEVLADKNLFVFPDHMSLANCNAAKECHVFATQAATAQFHPTTQADQWFGFYIDVMQQTGWIPVRYEMNRTVSSNVQLQVSNLLGKGLQVALGFLSGGIIGAAKEVGTAAIDALANSPEAIELLQRDTLEKDRSGLSLAQCNQSANGEVVMLLTAVHTDAEPDVNGNFLLFKWNSNGSTTYTGVAALVFHRGLYEQNRDVLIDRVSKNARSTLLSLKLKR